MTSFNSALAALDERPQRVAASVWPGSLTALDQPGLYAWWVDAAGAMDLSAGLGMHVPAGRIYVGQAGAASSRQGIPSASTLRSRIGGDHLRGTVRRSTLRRTLASVLLAPLTLVIEGPRLLEPASEARLSEWMGAHLAIATWAVDSGARLAELEERVVEALQPPLNIEHMPAGELRARLRALRAVVVHGIDDLWVPPDPALTDWRKILGEYGQAFDGYRYAKLAQRRECADVAEEVWRRRNEQGRFASPFAELRCALFWLQRSVRNAEQSPGWTASADLVERVQSLYDVIGAAWRREHGEEA